MPSNEKRKQYKNTIKTYGYMGVANGIIIEDDGLYGGTDCRDETSAIGY